MSDQKCDIGLACGLPITFRIYASYNADAGENVHPLHARYPGAMYRVCERHIGELMANDAELPGSTRQWLIVFVDPGPAGKAEKYG